MKVLALILGQVFLTVILYTLGVVIIGTALFPCVLFVMSIWQTHAQDGILLQVFLTSLAAAGSYFIFGFLLMLLAGAVRSLLCIRLKEGTYKIGEFESIKWFFVNALFLIVRTMFMDFIMLTPFCSLFYRLMGAKLGLNVQINSKNVADHSLLEIGNNSVIGGNATVIGHIFEPKGLRLMKVTIGKNVVIGLNSVIMPGVKIGDNSVVAAGAIVPKETVIEDHTIYYSPDRQVKKQEHK